MTLSYDLSRLCMYLTHQQKDRHFSTFQQNPATPSRSISPQIQASSTVTICVKRGSSAFLKTNNYRRQSQQNAIRTFALHLWGQLVGSRVNKLIIDAQVQWLFWDILVAAYKPTIHLFASVNKKLIWWGRIVQWIALSLCTQRPRVRFSALLRFIGGTA